MHGECVLLHAPGTDAEDTRLHIQTAPCIFGGMRTLHIRDGPGCCGQWDQSTPSSYRGSRALSAGNIGWDYGYFHGCQPCGPTHPAPVFVSAGSQGWRNQTGLWGRGPTPWDALVSVHPSAPDVHTRGCVQELILYSSSECQECSGLMVHLEAPWPSHSRALQSLAVRGQGRDRGDARLLGPDRKETSPPWSVTQTRWGCAGVQACGVVTDRNRSKAAGRKRLGGTPAGSRALAALTTSGPATAPLGTSPCLGIPSDMGRC